MLCILKPGHAYLVIKHVVQFSQRFSCDGDDYKTCQFCQSKKHCPRFQTKSGHCSIALRHCYFELLLGGTALTYYSVVLLWVTALWHCSAVLLGLLFSWYTGLFVCDDALVNGRRRSLIAQVFFCSILLLRSFFWNSSFGIRVSRVERARSRGGLTPEKVASSCGIGNFTKTWRKICWESFVEMKRFCKDASFASLFKV